jgi:beta-lactamase class A
LTYHAGTVILNEKEKSMKAMKLIDSTARRSLLLALAALPFASIGARAGSMPGNAKEKVAARLAALEASAHGRLGMAAFDTTDGSRLDYRSDERFAFCSTFKLMLVAAILARAAAQPALLDKRLYYKKSDLAHYSPISEKHVADGMLVAELCAAAIQYSDNTAANTLLKILGGLAAVTAFARTIGDTEFRLDRWEPELNTAIPGDFRDTTTPAAMARSLQRLTLGDALTPPLRAQLLNWLRGNTTGNARIRAGVPASWQVGDKTGTGNYGSTNDVAILMPPGRAPLFLALYFTQPDKNADSNSEVLAAATRIVVESFV